MSFFLYLLYFIYIYLFYLIYSQELVRKNLKNVQILLIVNALMIVLKEVVKSLQNVSNLLIYK